IGERQKQRRNDEGKMDADEPPQFAVAFMRNVHESFEQLDRRDRDDRSRQRHVDDRQFRQQDRFIVELRKLSEELVKMQSGLAEQCDQADREPEVERGQQKPAREEEALDYGLDHRSPRSSGASSPA